MVRRIWENEWLTVLWNVKSLKYDCVKMNGSQCFGLSNVSKMTVTSVCIIIDWSSWLPPCCSSNMYYCMTSQMSDKGVKHLMLVFWSLPLLCASSLVPLYIPGIQLLLMERRWLPWESGPSVRVTARSSSPTDSISLPAVHAGLATSFLFLKYPLLLCSSLVMHSYCDHRVTC